MNIVLINHYAGSPEFGMEYRPYYLSKYWVEQGHNVTIVASDFSHLRAKQPNVKSHSLYTEEYIDGIRYVWVKGNRYSGNGVARVINIVMFVAILTAIIKKIVKQPDLVITSSTYPVDIYPARRLVKQYPQCKLVFEPHDLWPMVLYEIGGMSKTHPFVRWMQSAEELSCRISDSVISMHPQNIDHLEAVGCDRSKFFHIPNGVDLSAWDNPEGPPELHSKFIKELKDKGHKVFIYTGSVSVANGLDVLLDVAEILKNDKISIVIVGEGPEKKNLEKMSCERRLNVHLLPKIKKTQIPAVLSLTDVCYVGFIHNPLYKYGMSANKLWDYMMAGKPIIMSINSSNDPVKDAKCGLTVESGKAEDIALVMREFSQLTPNELDEMGRNGRKYVVENNDYQVLATKFLNYVESCDIKK